LGVNYDKKKKAAAIIIIMTMIKQLQTAAKT